MNFLERLKFVLSTKASASGHLLTMNPGQPVWTDRNYASFAKEAYVINVVGFSAINRIADAISSMDFDVWDGDEKIEEEDHPLGVLWKRPNPVQGQGEYIRAVVGFYHIAGNSYLERVMVGAQPKELWCLRPDRMQVIPGQEGLPVAYQYKHNSRTVRWDNDPVKGGDIRHIKSFHPLSDFYGLSPIEAGAFGIDQHNESMKWMQALLQNSARPSGALVVNKDEPLGDEQFNRLKNQIEDQHSGSSNAGRPMLLEGGMDWKAMSHSPKDMAALETKYSAARDVCLALGVPPQLLGIPGDNTYSNYQEARLAFYEDTVLPFTDFLMDEINAWLSPLYDGAILKPDIEKIPAIADKRQRLWEMADASSDLTVDERRELKGYPKLEEVVKGADGNVREANYTSQGAQASTRLPRENEGEEGENDKQVEEDVKKIMGRLAYG